MHVIDADLLKKTLEAIARQVGADPTLGRTAYGGGAVDAYAATCALLETSAFDLPGRFAGPAPRIVQAK
jgi:hypothetical protein